MPKFYYVGKDSIGRKVSNFLNASNKSEAITRLAQNNIKVLRIKEVKGRKGLLSDVPPPRIKTSDLCIFTRQLATMISSGISLLEALEILKEQAQDKGFQYTLDEIIEDVRKGTDLSEALNKHPKVFRDIYVNMIRAGEASGKLEEILIRLAEYQEAAEKLKSEIKSAMTYPVVSLVMVLGITVFLLVVIVPKFKKIFDGLGVTLPLLTQYVLNFSLFLKENLLEMIGVSVLTIIVCVLLKNNTYIGKKIFAWIILRLPIFGPLFQKVALSRFAKTFATLIQSGVPILGALDIVASTSGNVIIEEVIKEAKESIKKGEPLSIPLAKSWVFPPMVTRMIAIGEKSGALETLLNKISEFYDQQVKATVEALTSLIEPLMIGFMGLLVGGIVLSIFLPIFKIQQVLQK